MPSLFAKKSSLGQVPVFAAYSTASTIKVLHSDSGEVCIEAPVEAIQEFLSALSNIPEQTSGAGDSNTALQQAVSALSATADANEQDARNAGNPEAPAGAGASRDQQSRQWLLRMVSRRRDHEAQRSQDGAAEPPRRWLFSMVSKKGRSSAQGSTGGASARGASTRSVGSAKAFEVTAASSGTVGGARGSAARMHKQVSFRPDAELRGAPQSGPASEDGAGSSKLKRTALPGEPGQDLTKFPSQLGLQLASEGDRSDSTPDGNASPAIKHGAAWEACGSEAAAGMHAFAPIQHGNDSMAEPARMSFAASQELDAERNALEQRIFGGSASTTDIVDDLDEQRSLLADRIFGAGMSSPTLPSAGSGNEGNNSEAGHPALNAPALQAIAAQLANDTAGHNITQESVAMAVQELHNVLAAPQAV